MDDNRNQLIREALRMAELNLSSQLSVMLAADQRATTLSGMIIATLAVVTSLYDQDAANWVDDLGLVILGVAALLAVYSARSVKVTVPGNTFKNFSTDIDTNRKFAVVLSEMGEICDQASLSNRKIMRRNAQFYNAALTIAATGFVVSLLPHIFKIGAKVRSFMLAMTGIPT